MWKSIAQWVYHHNLLSEGFTLHCGRIFFWSVQLLAIDGANYLVAGGS